MAGLTCLGSYIINKAKIKNSTYFGVLIYKLFGTLQKSSKVPTILNFVNDMVFTFNDTYCI